MTIIRSILCQTLSTLIVTAEMLTFQNRKSTDVINNVNYCSIY